MKVVSDGLKTLVDAAPGSVHNSFYTAIGGRFYYGVAPQNPTFPYCIHWLPNDKHDPYFVEKYEDILVQFDIYDKATTAVAIDAAGEALKALFDDAVLTVTGYTALPMLREFSIPPDPDTTTGIFQYTFQYRLIVEKNR